MGDVHGGINGHQVKLIENPSTAMTLDQPGQFDHCQTLQKAESDGHKWSDIVEFVDYFRTRERGTS
jgi:hypothetical protein